MNSATIKSLLGTLVGSGTSAVGVGSGEDALAAAYAYEKSRPLTVTEEGLTHPAHQLSRLIVHHSALIRVFPKSILRAAVDSSSVASVA